MSLYILASGSLVSDPVSRTSGAGKTFATGMLRVPIDGSEATFLSIIAFEATAQSLLAHSKGDAISVTGRGELKAWTSKDGEERHGLSIVADALLTVHQVRRKREAVADATEAAT